MKATCRKSVITIGFSRSRMPSAICQIGIIIDIGIRAILTRERIYYPSRDLVAALTFVDTIVELGSLERPQSEKMDEPFSVGWKNVLHVYLINV